MKKTPREFTAKAFKGDNVPKKASLSIHVYVARSQDGGEVSTSLSSRVIVEGVALHEIESVLLLVEEKAEEMRRRSSGVRELLP